MEQTLTKLTLKTRKNGCHICNNWTMFRGCDHYGPDGFDKNKEIIKLIVEAVHGGNPEIVETNDFTEGINAALIVLRQNGLLKIK